LVRLTVRYKASGSYFKPQLERNLVVSESQFHLEVANTSMY
jgi:hypothetical protein